jgi:hypothetical protein
MARLFIPAALAMLALAGAVPAIAKTADTPSAAGVEDATPMPDRLRARLTADGYKDITILPTTYAVSATDKSGKPVLLLIGPGSSTVLEGTDDPSTAESKEGDKKEMQQ